MFPDLVMWSQGQDLITKNPCDFCKPPKRDKTFINTLNKNERSRMLALARKAQPAAKVPSIAFAEEQQLAMLE